MEQHRLRIYNTLTRETAPLVTAEPGMVRLYVCGMTVYDEAHVGHARAMVVFDAFARFLRWDGWKLRFVRNFTDVDDKIITRAAALGETPEGLAQRYIDAFHRDTEALGLLRPDSEPRVTTSMPAITAMIEALVAKGHAYVSEGSVWFSVSSCEDYGKLSGQRPDQMLAASEGTSGKRADADFALWKASKDHEPSWPSPWGPGRPGWHIECSAMVQEAFGGQVDIHGGGLDLVFPHHENEIAQSECAHGLHPYARVWMHNGLLVMQGGQKMGKSLGNVFNIHEALKLYPAEALRLYYLQVHYRTPLPWGEQSLDASLALLARLYEAKERALDLCASLAGEAQGFGKDTDDADSNGDHDTDQGTRVMMLRDVAGQLPSLGAEASAVLNLVRDFPERVREALRDDFNTAKVVGYACELARAFNRFAGTKQGKKHGAKLAYLVADALGILGGALHLLDMCPEAFQEEVKHKRLPSLGCTRDEIDAAIAARTEARAQKLWATSDAIRDDLARKGIALMDGPEGTDWRVVLESAEIGC